MKMNKVMFIYMFSLCSCEHEMNMIYVHFMFILCSCEHKLNVISVQFVFSLCSCERNMNIVFVRLLLVWCQIILIKLTSLCVGGKKEFLWEPVDNIRALSNWVWDEAASSCQPSKGEQQEWWQAQENQGHRCWWAAHESEGVAKGRAKQELWWRVTQAHASHLKSSKHHQLPDKFFEPKARQHLLFKPAISTPRQSHSSWKH